MKHKEAGSTLPMLNENVEQVVRNLQIWETASLKIFILFL